MTVCTRQQDRLRRLKFTVKCLEFASAGCVLFLVDTLNFTISYLTSTAASNDDVERVRDVSTSVGSHVVLLEIVI